MRTTLALDDELLVKARALTGLQEKSAIVREALRALIERESARRLARLGGSAPDIADAPRRRPWKAWSSSTPRSGSIICEPATHGSKLS